MTHTVHLIDNTWYLQLVKRKADLPNPYRPPTSTLRHRAGHTGDWSLQAISSAEKYVKCLLRGYGSALCTVLLAWLVIDIFLNGWEPISLANIPTQLLVLIAISLSFVGNSQFSKTYVKNQTRRKTEQQFFNASQRVLQKWYGGPLVLTIGIGLNAILFLIGVNWIRNLMDFQSTVSTFRLRALLAILPVLPIVYLMLRYTLQKASKYLQIPNQ